MFPYPSGRIHMGHVRNYTMGDVVARYKLAARLQRAAPDGLGRLRHAGRERRDRARACTPATGPTRTSPRCGRRCSRSGLSIDWSREFATCDPEYYGQQQALFLDMLEAGLVARKAAVVNWDPVDMTVLANEQVIDGKGWRSGAPVERRELTQWFFRISDMAEELLDGDRRAGRLAGEGAHDAAQLDRQEPRAAVRASRPRGAPAGFETLEVYTTRPDTLLGASFAAVSPDHPLAKALEGDPAVAAFVAECRRDGHQRGGDRDRREARLRHRHPGGPPVRPGDWELPVWIANFILMDYGTGAIFGCPAHDQRDLDFARKYGLPVIDVFMPRRARTRGSSDEAYRAAEDRAGRLPAPGRRRAADDRRGGGRGRDRLLRGARASAKGVIKFRLRDWGI